MTQFAKPVTIVRPKIVRVDAQGVAPLGRTRSIPHAIDTTMPKGGLKFPKPQERPVEIGTQDLQGRPFTEPENVPTLEPVSRP